MDSPMLSTPLHRSPVIVEDADKANGSSSGIKFPGELSFKPSTASKKRKSICSSQKEDHKFSPQSFMVNGYDKSGSPVDSSNMSHDLQVPCNHTIAMVVSTKRRRLLETPLKQCRSGTLFEESTISVDDIPVMDHLMSCDAFSFDLLSAVCAIGKESVQQALKDVGAEGPTECSVQECALDCEPARNNGPGKSVVKDSCESLVEEHGTDVNSRKAGVSIKTNESSVPSIPMPECADGIRLEKTEISGENNTYPTNSNQSDEMKKHNSQRPGDLTGTCLEANNPGSCDQPASPVPVPFAVDDVSPQGKRSRIAKVASTPSWTTSWLNGPGVVLVAPSSPEREFFAVAGSVDISVRSRSKRFGRHQEMIDLLAGVKKSPLKMKQGVVQTYAEQVENSVCFAKLTSTENGPSIEGSPQKICIDGFSISEEEFVQAVMPNGHIHDKFMIVCSLAINRDWGSRTKIVLPQSFVVELLKTHRCDRKELIDFLRCFSADSLDQIYMPLRNGQHWVLVLVSISGKLVEIYDPVRRSVEVGLPDKDMLDTILYNLEIAYAYSYMRTIPLAEQFKRVYVKIPTQPNLHDSGLEVIRLILRHNGKHLIGYGKMNMCSFRKDLAYILIHHRFNRLNPRRDG